MSNKFLKRLIVYCNLAIVTLVISATPACAALKRGFKAQVVDEELKPYTNAYFDLLKKECPSFDRKQDWLYVIELVNEEKMDEEDWIGVCIRQVYGYHIQVKKEWWYLANDNAKKQLIFHEMSHCIIDRLHDPSSNHYMYAYFRELPHDKYYKQATTDIRDFCVSE